MTRPSLGHEPSGLRHMPPRTRPASPRSTAHGPAAGRRITAGQSPVPPASWEATSGQPVGNPVVLVPPLLAQRPDVGVEQLPVLEDIVVAVLAEHVGPRAPGGQLLEEPGEPLIGAGAHLPGRPQPSRLAGSEASRATSSRAKPMLAAHSARPRSTISRLAREGSRFALGVLEHGADPVEAGRRRVGQFVLGAQGHQEQFGDAGLEVCLG